MFCLSFYLPFIGEKFYIGNETLSAATPLEFANSNNYRVNNANYFKEIVSDKCSGDLIIRRSVIQCNRYRLYSGLKFLLFCGNSKILRRTIQREKVNGRSAQEQMSHTTEI